MKVITETTGLEVVAINDLLTIETAAYLLKYDSVYGIYDKEVSAEGDYLKVGDKKIKYLSVKNPSELPRKEFEIDTVIESTGLFTNREDAEKHIYAGEASSNFGANKKYRYAHYEWGFTNQMIRQIMAA